jgi:hypothetical protein|eukprot:7376507-Prymnesium_polylepis.2
MLPMMLRLGYEPMALALDTRVRLAPRFDSLRHTDWFIYSAPCAYHALCQHGRHNGRQADAPPGVAGRSQEKSGGGHARCMGIKCIMVKRGAEASRRYCATPKAMETARAGILGANAYWRLVGTPRGAPQGQGEWKKVCKLANLTETCLEPPVQAEQ